MAEFIPDEIIENILARVPTKTFLRCRCVSTYRNRLLSEPNFMKLRSRRTIILPQPKNCLHIHDTIRIDGTPNSMLERRYPLDNLRRQCGVSRVIGTFNGLVMLAYSGMLILYNPFTGASKKLPEAPGKRVYHHGYGCGPYGYGFGYGATPNDLKLVRFGRLTHICDVYSFQNSSWSTSQYNTDYFAFEHDVGTFLNGFLYWITFGMRQLTVLNLKDMELSTIHLPFERGLTGTTILGTIDGCLCSLNNINGTRFDIWVMNKHDVENLWSLKRSFRFPFEGTLNTYYHPLCILDSGRILMANTRRQLVICDMLNSSYKTFNILLSEYYPYHQIHGLEYVESLFSPSDMCPSLRLEYNCSKKKRKT